MENLLQALRADFPNLRFTKSTSFCWSPATQEVCYNSRDNNRTTSWSLLHETGHALLNHAEYTLDFELLELERAAWEKALGLAKRYDISIDKDHIEDCLDTYRDWLHRRSICPSCSTQALQMDKGATYRCHNCQNTWRVTPSRFCRPYRQNAAKTKSPATFR
jgi:NADH pyrophosphatase NudC (nudix superfamily)